MLTTKLSDLLTGSRAHRPSLQGSVFWMAPEVVKQTAYTRKADIWSVGCLIVEMLTGEHPWAQLSQMQAIFKVRTQPANQETWHVRSVGIDVTFVDWFLRQADNTLRHIGGSGKLPSTHF